MNSTWKVVKYQIQDAIKVVRVYYGILFCIGCVIAMFGWYETRSGSNVQGIGISTAIFLFVYGLNCFKVNFRFMQAYNISRVKFYKALIITFALLSGVMAAIEVIVTKLLQLVVAYEGMYEQVYKKDFIIANFIWSFALYMSLLGLGWFITMIYYRANKLMKTFVSLTPVFLIMLQGLLENLIGGAVVHKAGADFFGAILGFSDNNNSYMAVLSFGILAMGIYALCYLLIRRIPIKV